MTEFTDEKLRSMLGKVQALLDRANHPSTPPHEADSARDFAEKLMKKYRIEEEMLRQSKIASGTAAKPVDVMFTFLTDLASPYANHYYSLLLACTNHVGVRGMQTLGRDEEGKTVYNYRMIGFDSDIQVAQLLYTNLRLTFSEKLEPRRDPSLSDADNIYRLRSAGIERIRIAKIMWGDGSHANNAKVTKLYAQACKACGEDPKVVGRSVNAKTYRESFASAFVSETRARFRRMKQVDSEESTALVLAGREDAVNEAFYEAYPELRPRAVIDSPRQSIRSQCDKCRKSKRGACREHYIAMGSYRERPHSSLGWSSGTNAAREADLSRAGGVPTGKLTG